MRKFCVAVFVCLASAAFASVTISGNLKDLTGTAVSSRTFVRFTIRGCNGNQPRKAGTAIIVPSIYEFTPNASGVVSGTLYDSLTDIECGGVVGATWYGVTIFRDGKPNPEVPYNVTGTTFNLNSALPNTTNPVVAAPTGDSTYARLDGLNQPFTGNITAPSFIGSLTGNASTATALAANGTNCTAGNYPLGVDASGNVENCTAATSGSGTVTNIATTSPISGGPITTTGTIACATCVTASSPGAGVARFAGSTQAVTSAELSGDATTSGSNAVTVAKVNGVSYSSSPSTDTVPVITAANTATYKSVPDCQDTTGNHLNYTASTHTIGCGTSSATVNNFAYGGSGVDGALAFDGATSIACASLAAPVYTLTRECYATTIVVSNGVTVNTGGSGHCFIMQATTSVSVSGTIQNVGPVGSNGNLASGGGGGNAPCRDSTSARIGQLALSNNVAPGGVSGALGGNAVGANGTNANATNSSGSSNYCPVGASASGSAGGAGGAGGSAGGSAGSVGAGGGTTPTNVAQSVNDGISAWRWRDPTSTANVYTACWQNGGGSAGGAGGGNGGVINGGNGGGSGGNGATGGIVFIASPTITVSATGIISADGGNGGNGGNGANGSGGGGGGGGGGAGGSGGPGGFVVLFYHSFTNSGTVHANGGTGGNGGTHGNGNGGSNGSDGNTGAAGKAGVVFQFAS